MTPKISPSFDKPTNDDLVGILSPINHEGVWLPKNLLTEAKTMTSHSTNPKTIHTVRGPFTPQPGLGPSFDQLGLGMGWCINTCNLDQARIRNFTAPNASSVCHTFRPQLCSRWQMMYNGMQTVLRSRAEHGSYLSWNGQKIWTQHHTHSAWKFSPV